MANKKKKLRPSLPPLDVLDALENRINWSELSRRAGMEPARLSQCRRQQQGKALSSAELATLASQLSDLAETSAKVAEEVRALSLAAP